MTLNWTCSDQAIDAEYPPCTPDDPHEWCIDRSEDWEPDSSEVVAVQRHPDAPHCHVNGVCKSVSEETP